MINQLKFSLNDILSRPFTFIFTFIQITASLLLIALSFSTVSSLLDYTSRFEIFENTNDVYLICDNTDEAYFNDLLSNNCESTLEKSEDLYSYMSNMEGITTYSFITNGISIKSNTELSNVTPANVFDDGENVYVSYNLIRINQGFAKFYNLKCESGKMFSDSDYLQASSKTPVVLGYNYKEYFKIGDDFEDEFIVIGFLEKGSFYLNPKSCGEVLNLDNYVMAPMLIDSDDNLLDLDNAIFSTTIFTDDTDKLEKIKKKSDELGVYDISFRSYSDQLNWIIETKMNQVAFMLAIILIILFFCIISFISTLLNFIETHKKEFSVHLLCGAIKRDFIFRIIWQIASIILISDIIILILFKFSCTFTFTLFVSIFILAITLFLPILKMKKLTINELLKRNE